MRIEYRVDLMKKYFQVFPAKYPSFGLMLKTSLFLVVFGAGIIYFFNNTILAGIFFVLTGSGLFSLWIKPYFRDKRLFSERPTVQQMYNWLVADLNTQVKNRAVEALRLNASYLRPENFIIVSYPLYWNEPGVEETSIIRRETEDGTILYNVWKVQVIALTKNYISFYNCTYDWIGNKLLNERTNEFFYDDISSVKNDVESIERKLIGAEENTNLTTFVFKVTNMSSDSLSVITNIPELKYSPSLVVSLEKAVQALRIILRKRRYDEDQDPIIIEPETNTEDEAQSEPGNETK
ncbi:MAG: hypothetical protein U0W24_18490 [Bacteroidales bacterium]